MDLSDEDAGIKLAGMGADSFRMILTWIETLHGCFQTLARHRLEVFAGEAGDDRIQRAAAFVGNDGPAGGLRLYAGDAKIFQPGKQECLAFRH